MGSLLCQAPQRPHPIIGDHLRSDRPENERRPAELVPLLLCVERSRGRSACEPLVAPVVVAASVLAAFWPMLANDFVDLDDRTWLIENYRFRGLGAWRYSSHSPYEATPAPPARLMPSARMRLSRSE